MISEAERERVRRAPYVVWVDYGCEGWEPTPYETLEQAVGHESYGNAKIVTKRCAWQAVEASD